MNWSDNAAQPKPTRMEKYSTRSQDWALRVNVNANCTMPFLSKVSPTDFQLHNNAVP